MQTASCHQEIHLIELIEGASQETEDRVRILDPVRNQD